MIVYDLQCAARHVFEGWFESDDDFQSQCATQMLLCPLCGDGQISKRLSAPRLNFGARQDSDPGQTTSTTEPAPLHLTAQKQWLEVARNIVANTDDVGEQFVDEARRMHYGEAPERAIRGIASPVEAVALLEEGIAVLPFALPESLKNPLQ
jgi:hypothetical protein